MCVVRCAVALWTVTVGLHLKAEGQRAKGHVARWSMCGVRVCVYVCACVRECTCACACGGNADANGQSLMVFRFRFRSCSRFFFFRVLVRVRVHCPRSRISHAAAMHLALAPRDPHPPSNVCYA